MRRGDGKRGTFILNNSDQYAILTSVHYVVGLASAPADEVLAVVAPGESKYVPWKTHFLFSLDDEDDLPEEVDIPEGRTWTVRYWVTWADFEPELGPLG